MWILKEHFIVINSYEKLHILISCTNKYLWNKSENPGLCSTFRGVCLPCCHAEILFPFFCLFLFVVFCFVLFSLIQLWFFRLIFSYNLKPSLSIHHPFLSPSKGTKIGISRSVFLLNSRGFPFLSCEENIHPKQLKSSYLEKPNKIYFINIFFVMKLISIFQLSFSFFISSHT